MSQAIDAYYTITASSQFREMERLRAKARHDEAQALHHAKQEGMQEGMQKGMQEGMQKGISQRSAEIAKSLLKMGMPLDQIVQVTGLTPEELDRL